jgi:hypothetical protein
MSDTLSLAIDYSSTGPKFFYGRTAAELLPAIIAPQVVEVSVGANVNSLYRDLPDYSLIGLDDRRYLTGQAACNFLRGAVYLKAAKIDKAIPQTLSAIGYAADRLGLSGKIDLDLQCLLPAGEIGEDRSRLELEIASAVKNFTTLGKKYQCRLRSFACKPEGSGLLRKFADLRGLPLDALSIGILSLGYRNAGFFSLVHRTPGHYRSPRLGFNVLVDEFRSQVGGLDEVDITKELSKYLETGDRVHLTKIAKLGKDLDAIANKAEAARDIYCHRLQRDIQEYLPDVDEIVAGGGSVLALHLYLSELFGRNSVSFHAGLGKAWDYPERFKDLLEDDLYYRFADLYCFCEPVGG